MVFLIVYWFGGPFVVNSTSEIEAIMLTKITARFRGVSRLFLFLMTMLLAVYVFRKKGSTINVPLCFKNASDASICCLMFPSYAG